jgi:hypothetical protein
VTRDVEGIGRLSLPVYVPKPQRELGVVGFLRCPRGHLIACSALLAPISDAFLTALEDWTDQHAIPILTFTTTQGKDAVAPLEGAMDQYVAQAKLTSET